MIRTKPKGMVEINNFSAEEGTPPPAIKKNFAEPTI